MPYERFFKLKEDKQKRITSVAFAEFMEKGYEQASINRIIKEAGISRGSFYTYFADKEDLFSYVTAEDLRLIKNFLEESYLAAGKDMFVLAESIMERGLRMEPNGVNAGLIRRFSSFDYLAKVWVEADLQKYREADEAADRRSCWLIKAYEENPDLRRKSFQDFEAMMELLMTLVLALVEECLAYKRNCREEYLCEQFLKNRKMMFQRQIKMLKAAYEILPIQ